MFVTLASLVIQTAREIAQFGTKLRVIVLGKCSEGYKQERFVCMESIDKDHSTWDTKDPANVDVVFVISINWWCEKFGPTAYWQWATTHPAEYQKQRYGVTDWTGTTDWRHEKKEFGAPIDGPAFPQGWIKGKNNILAIDECQELVRNVNNYWKSLRWVSADKVILLSGYPAHYSVDAVLLWLYI